MKVSVCITVLNEEGSVGELIDSLLTQTKKPDEIFIVDAGSTDKTLEIIRHFQKKDKRIKLLVEKGSTAHGRNMAIELAKYPIIASTDAGCVAKRDWLQKLIEPFKYKNVGLVAGFYEMQAKNPMQEAMNVFHGIAPQMYDPTTFLPSARSVAFRKVIWERVGGYSEKFEKAGEDTDFFYKIVKQGVKIVRVKEARVVWRESSTFTLSKSMKKFYQYAKGDARSGIWWHPSKQLTSHNIKISLIFLRYLAGFILLTLSFSKVDSLSCPPTCASFWRVILLLLLILYIFRSFRKVYLQTNSLKAGAWGIAIQFMSDFAVMGGFTSGMLGKKNDSG